MKKYYIYHNCDKDSYIYAEDVSLSPGGELCFVINNKLIACFSRHQWEFMKEIKEE